MRYSVEEMCQYMKDEELVIPVLHANRVCKNRYSIMEIFDAKFQREGDKVRLISKDLDLYELMEDDNIITAVINEIYLTAFVERNQDAYFVHVLVSKYPRCLKKRYEKEIFDEVIDYMLQQIIKSQNLTTKGRLMKYIEDEELDCE